MTPAERAVRAKELGNSAYKEERFGDAVVFYCEAVAHDPDTATYHANLSAAYFELGAYEDARASCAAGMALLREQGGRSSALALKIWMRIARLQLCIPCSEAMPYEKVAAEFPASRDALMAAKAAFARSQSCSANPSSLASDLELAAPRFRPCYGVGTEY